MTDVPGKRTPLILVSGLLCDPLLWASQIAALSDIADCWVVNPTEFDSMKALAANLLEHSPFETFSLAGLSMGGYVALEIMRQAPARVEKLALLDTTARPELPEQTVRRRKLMDLAQNGGLDEVTQTLLPALISGARSGDTQITGTIRTMARNIGSNAFIRQETAIIGRLDSRPHLASIHCDTMVLCGGQDAMTPPDLHREIANGIKGATLTIVEHCGHLSTLEQPEQVNLAMRAWLKG